MIKPEELNLFSVAGQMDTGQILLVVPIQHQGQHSGQHPAKQRETWDSPGTTPSSANLALQGKRWLDMASQGK